jgi:hypothetical protein
MRNEIVSIHHRSSEVEHLKAAKISHSRIGIISGAVTECCHPREVEQTTDLKRRRPCDNHLREMIVYISSCMDSRDSRISPIRLSPTGHSPMAKVHKVCWRESGGHSPTGENPVMYWQKFSRQSPTGESPVMYWRKYCGLSPIGESTVTFR